MAKSQKPKKENSVPKAYNWTFSLWPESQQALIDYAKETFCCAWALHDHDTYTEQDYQSACERLGDSAVPDFVPGDTKKPHVHFVVRLSNQRYCTALAKEFNRVADEKCCAPVFPATFEKCKTLYGSFWYLCHLNAPDKFQYDSNIIHLENDFVPPSEQDGINSDGATEVEILLNMPRFNSLEELAVWAYQQGCWGAFRRNYSLWKDIYMERREHPSETESCISASRRLSDCPFSV